MTLDYFWEVKCKLINIRASECLNKFLNRSWPVSHNSFARVQSHRRFNLIVIVDNPKISVNTTLTKMIEQGIAHSNDQRDDACLEKEIYISRRKHRRSFLLFSFVSESNVALWPRYRIDIDAFKCQEGSYARQIACKIVKTFIRRRKKHGVSPFEGLSNVIMSSLFWWTNNCSSITPVFIYKLTHSLARRFV